MGNHGDCSCAEMHVGLHTEWPLKLSSLNTALSHSIIIHSILYVKVHENPLSHSADIFWVDIRTDREQI
jgi:hypothetical protein